MIAYLPHLVSFLVGFVSLGMEILWVRMVGFAGHSTPMAFALVLALYLTGIVIGANAGKNLCRGKKDFPLLLAAMLALSAIANLFCVTLFVCLFDSLRVTIGPYYTWILDCPLIVASAAFPAAIFPVVHHIVGGKNTSRLGRSLSFVYGANIAGSSLGPLMTNFGLLAIMSTQQSVPALQALLLPPAILCVACSHYPRGRKYASGIAGVISLACLLWIASIPQDGMYRKLANILDGQHATKIVETARGIVAVYHEDKGGDIVTGGNVYDGRTNLDPVINSNGIDRILILDALAKKPPKHVLVIGVSSGNWLTLITAFPGVETIDAIEINDGYLMLIRDYPQQQKALNDPRVRVYVTDGVKWLREHPDRKFDMVVMNTTLHWRAFATNLLSIETMRLLHQHITPDALLTFNTTMSIDSFVTAAAVFPYAYLRGSFAIASDADFLKGFDKNAAAQKLLALKLDGKQLYHDGPNGVVRDHIDVPFLTLAEAKGMLKREPEIVTQDNMLTEYRYGRPLF